MIDEDQEDEDEPCPVCRSDLQIRLLASKSNDEVSWYKYQYQCFECDYKGLTWEIVE